MRKVEKAEKLARVGPATFLALKRLLPAEVWDHCSAKTIAELVRLLAEQKRLGELEAEQEAAELLGCTRSEFWEVLSEKERTGELWRADGR